MPAGWLRPISATAMPAKPAPPRSRQQPCRAHRRSRSCPPARPARRRWPSASSTCALRLDAGIGAAPGREAHRTQTIAGAVPPQQQVHARRQAAASASSRLRFSGDARPRCRPAQQPRACPASAPPGRRRALRRHVAGSFSVVDQQPDQQRRGHEVEHDGGDDDMAAAMACSAARHRGPGHAEERAASTISGSSSQAGRCAAGQRHQRRAQPAQHGLAFAADVEQPAVKGHRHRQPGEDEGGGVVQRVAEAARRAEGALQQQADSTCPGSCPTAATMADAGHRPAPAPG
jgi:hypothetical protein